MIGWTLPPEVEAEVIRIDSIGPGQTFAFYQGMAECLRTANIDQEFVSFWPVQDFPRVKKLFIPGGRWTTTAGERGRYLPFINFLGLKHLSRWFAGMGVVGQWAKQVSGRRAVIVGGVHSVSLWLGVRAAKIARCPFIVVLTDPAGVPIPGEKGLRAKVRQIDNDLIRKALTHANGAIGVTEQLCKLEAPGATVLVMEGFMRPELVTQFKGPKPPESKPAKLVYAGRLSAEYGVAAMLGAMPLLPDTVELHLFGKGPMQEEVEAAASKDARIKYHGYRSMEVIYEAIKSSTLYLNFRPVGQSIEDLSFPSKLLEALGLGAVILTTPLSGIPTDYHGAVEFAPSIEPEDVAKQIRDLLESPERRAEIRAHARALVEKRCLPEARGQLVRAFIEQLFP